MAIEPTWLGVRVADAREIAADIMTFELVSADGSGLPAHTPGSHVSVALPSGLVRQYSLCNDPQDATSYVIAVHIDRTGRGGSMEMKAHLTVGREISITAPTNLFGLNAQARRHVLIAGGIGITPLLCMARFLHRTGASWHLHYCARCAERAAFHETIRRSELGASTSFHFDGGVVERGLDLTALLAKESDPDTHVYCCGPNGLMAAVKAAGAGRRPGTMHFEAFSAAEEQAPQTANHSFEVEIADTGAVYTVHPHQSILEVLEANGHRVPRLCKEGICGTCLVEYVEGEPDHRDRVLDDDTRKTERLIAICCSRSLSPRLKLVL